MMQNKYFVSRLFLITCCKFLSCIIRPAGQGIFQEVSYQSSTLADLLNQKECFRLTVMSVCAGELFMIQAASAYVVVIQWQGKKSKIVGEGRARTNARGASMPRRISAMAAARTSGGWTRRGIGLPCPTLERPG
jgi:hypothetical protein